MDTIKRSRLIVLIPLIALFITGCSFSVKAVTDAGIFYSQDEGETWVHRIFIEEGKKAPVTLGSQNTRFFVFHPTDQNIVYASMENNLYKSMNKGEDWDHVNLLGVVQSFIIDPNTPELQYASSGQKIYKTANDGETWTQVYIDRPGVSVTALAIHKNDSSKIWAGNSDGSILVSEDYGNTWTAIALLSERIQRLVIPTTTQSTIYALLPSAGFAKSTDGGLSWDQTIAKTSLTDGGFASALPFLSFYLRPGTTGDIVIASNYGVLRSTNGGSSWNTIPTVIPSNTTPINAIVLNPKDPSKVFFTAANIFYASDDGGETWKTLQTIPTTHSAAKLDINPLNTNDLYIGINKIKE